MKVKLNNAVRESIVWLALLVLAHHDPVSLSIGMGIIIFFGDWYWCHAYRSTHHIEQPLSELHTELHLEHIVTPRLYRVPWTILTMLLILWDVCIK